MKTATPMAVDLFHQGSVALAQVERNGMRVDVDYLRNTITGTRQRIAEVEAELHDTDVWRAWHRKYGAASNLDSDVQLGEVLFGVLGYEHGGYTTGQRYRVDESVLERIDHPFCKKLIYRSKLDKIAGTYLEGIYRHVEGEYLHPFFNLHRVNTYRSSSSDPNFQNIPIRVPEFAEIIRQAFIPRQDHRIIEIDFSAIEVRVAACYHKDPTMLRYIREGYDMHRDMAIECYRLPAAKHFTTPEQKKYLKAARQHAKGLFVFAEFYGDYFKKVAPGLWDAVSRHDLRGPDGESLYDYLLTQGIETLGPCDPSARNTTPGTFEHHIKEVEDRFWNQRFPVYNKWRKDWYQAYLRDGGFSTLTGFRLDGVYSRNEVINYPVQGSAFHCLLWSLIEIQRWLNKNRMRSVIVGQIHDSIVADVHEDEVEDFLRYAHYVMTQKLLEVWDWIICPIEIEAEACGLGETWHHKKPIAIPT